MTELETMQRAKQYIHKLANGIDPLTDRPLPHDTVLHQVRISRCFFYVETLIDRAIEQESHPAKVRKKELPPFSLTPEQKQQVLLVHNPIPISQFVQAANAVADLDHMQKLKATDLTAWLVRKGFCRRSSGTTNARRNRPPMGTPSASPPNGGRHTRPARTIWPSSTTTARSNFYWTIWNRSFRRSLFPPSR